MLGTIAQALGIQETDGRPLMTLLGEALRATPRLLILNTFEHVLPAAPLIAHTTRLSVLVTSRAVLRLSAEQVIALPPLAVPSAGALPSRDELRAVASMRLSRDRAEAALPGFTLNEANAGALAGICRRLDGPPLRRKRPRAGP